MSELGVEEEGVVDCSSRLCGQTPNREPWRKEGLFGPQFERVQSILAAKKWQNSGNESVWLGLLTAGKTREELGYMCALFSPAVQLGPQFMETPHKYVLRCTF